MATLDISNDIFVEISRRRLGIGLSAAYVFVCGMVVDSGSLFKSKKSMVQRFEDPR